MPKIMKRMIDEDSHPVGMCPEVTKPVKRKARKKPSKYKAPITVKRYYKGIEEGIIRLRDDLLANIEDESLKQTIKKRAKTVLMISSRELTILEKKKQKEKETKWEQDEWERIDV